MAISDALKTQNFSYEYQYLAGIFYNGKKVGNRYFDYLVENKIIVEVKVGFRPAHKDFLQIKEYLKLSKKKLGLLVLFTEKGVKVYRVLNCN